MRYADLHRRPERRDYFVSERTGVAYDEGLRCWVIDDPHVVVEALRDPRIGSVNYVAGARQRGELLHSPLDNQEYAFDHIPIGWDGSDHAERRKAVARFMASRREALEAGLPLSVDRHIGKLDEDGDIELVSEVLLPLVNDMTGLLLGIEIGADIALQISPLFDRLLSLRHHAKIDASIGEARAWIREQLGGRGDDVDEGLRITLWILGYDAQLGTVGESLRALFEAHSGERISAIPYPEAPPETGVPYAERDALADIQLGGCEIPKGARLRIMLQGFAYSDRNDSASRIFGVGAHACLGRPLSLDLWRLIVARLQRIDRTVTFLGATQRTSDYVFVCPSSLRVRIGNE